MADQSIACRTTASLYRGTEHSNFSSRHQRLSYLWFVLVHLSRSLVWTDSINLPRQESLNSTMSLTKTILNYIQQNNRQNGHQSMVVPERSSYFSINGYGGEKQKPLRLPPRPRKPLAQKFPFTECTDLSLRHSRESIVQGVRFATRQYVGLADMLRWRHMIYNMLLSLDKQTYYLEVEGVEEAARDKLCQMLKMPSILVKNTQTNREELVEKFQKVVLICLQKKFGLGDDLVDDVRVREALNYATNLFLQAFKSSTTNGSCSKMSYSYTSGQLAEALYSLAYDFMDKYEEIALEHFEDMVFDGTSRASLQDPGATVERPVFYDYFRAIWKLDPPNLLEFRVDVFIDEYEGVQSHQYSNPLALEICPNKYGEIALKMNIHRFYWGYRDELQARKEAKSKIVAGDLDKMEEFPVLRDMVEQLTLCEEKKHTSQPKAKSLRFADPL